MDRRTDDAARIHGRDRHRKTPDRLPRDAGSGRPVVAILAEYDALPGIGHGCGHNIIAATAVGAAVGVKSVIGDAGGAIQVIGTPAEEVYGGKVAMLREGAFDGLDAAIMTHPGTAMLSSRKLSRVPNSRSSTSASKRTRPRSRNAASMRWRR